MDKQKQIEEMTNYYVIRNKDTGLYFRGKGVNRWGKYYNQATIYRVKGTAEASVREIAYQGEKAEIIPIHITEIYEGEESFGKRVREIYSADGRLGRKYVIEARQIRKEAEKEIFAILKKEFSERKGCEDAYEFIKVLETVRV